MTHFAHAIEVMWFTQSYETTVGLPNSKVLSNHIASLGRSCKQRVLRVDDAELIVRCMHSQRNVCSMWNGLIESSLDFDLS